MLFNRRFCGTHATATYNPNSDIIRLTIPYSTSIYQPQPGTYYYLHVLNDIRFWESHPFTVASTARFHDQPSVQEADGGAVFPNEISLLLQEGRGPTSNHICREETGKSQPTMTFLLRPYDSFTSRLRDMAAGAWPLPAPVRVLVDGPYGHTQRLDRFEHVLFIVGGSGIVVPISYLEYFSKSSSRPKSVRVIWAARESEFAAEVIGKDLYNYLDAGLLSLDVYITKDERGSGDVRSSDLPKEVRVLSDRPDVRAEVEITTKSSGGESLAVMACGPARMADDVRSSVVEMLAKRHSNVEYFEEAFRW